MAMEDMAQMAVTVSSLPLTLRLACKLLTSANKMMRRSDHTMNRWLSDLLDSKVKPSAIPDKGVFSKDYYLDPSNNKDLWVRIFVPDEDVQDEKLPVVLYYHGGGFAVLSPASTVYDIFCRRLAKQARCIVVSANYRRSPENRYPAAHEDGYEVLKWIFTKPDVLREHGADTSRVFLSGDSAGGNIAHHTACSAAKVYPNLVKGILLLQPFFGGEERTSSEVRLKDVPLISVESADWHWKAYLPPGEDRDHPICNVFGPRASDLSGLDLPPIVVVVGDFDTLQDWQTRYVDRMRALGKDVELLFYKGGVHAFHLFHKYPLSRQLILDLVKFISTH